MKNSTRQALLKALIAFLAAVFGAVSGAEAAEMLM